MHKAFLATVRFLFAHKNCSVVAGSRSLKAKASPLISQYFALKAQMPDALLLIRVGSFYELFFEDAVRASQLLNITLTSYGKYQEKTVQSCGFPVSVVSLYLEKLLQANLKVAICEQHASAGADKIMSRSVSQIITAGTFISDQSIAHNNYLLFMFVKHKQIYLTWLDCAIGIPFFRKISINLLNENLTCINPREILMCQSSDTLLKIMDSNFLLKLVKVPQLSADNIKKFTQELQQACSAEHWQELHKVDSVFQLGLLHIMSYFSGLYHRPLPRIFWLSDCVLKQGFILGKETLEALKIYNIHKAKSGGYLFDDINRTVTAGGNRRLHHLFTHPDADYDILHNRFSTIRYFTNRPDLVKKIQNILKELPDTERALNLMRFGHVSAKYLFFVYKLLMVIHQLKSLDDLPCDFADYAKVNHKIWLKLINVIDFTSCSIKDTDWQNVGNLFILGKHALWDKLQLDLQMLQEEILNLEVKYSQMTGLTSLKIVMNNQQRLSISISRVHARLADNMDWIYQSGTKDKCLFTNKELMMIENRLRVLNDQSKDMTTEILCQLQEDLVSDHTLLWEQLRLIYNLDVKVNFSLLVTEDNYTIPDITRDRVWHITQGWHPQVKCHAREPHTTYRQQSLNQHTDTPPVYNDFHADAGDLWLITGANMSGKSVFLKQNAIIAVLAHIGCPVPAKKAVIGLLTGVFLRVGFNDDLSNAQSTFLREMLDCERILSLANDRSLVIIDELGRGTKHTEGLVIAEAIIEHIHDHTKCLGLISTHYDDLTKLSDRLPRVKNYHMKILKTQRGLKFLYQVTAGVCHQSYGIYAAQYAGLPASVCQRAQQLLTDRES